MTSKISALAHHWSIPLFPSRRIRTVQGRLRYPESQRENKRTQKIRLNKAHWANIRSIYCLIDYHKATQNLDFSHPKLVILINDESSYVPSKKMSKVLKLNLDSNLYYYLLVEINPNLFPSGAIQVQL